MVISLSPVSKPRQTLSDRWKQRPVVLKWRAFADSLRAAVANEGFNPSNELVMEFHIEMPKSWSKKKKTEMEGKPHQQDRLDIDNLVKAILDALFEKDGCVHSISAKKLWAKTGWIKLENKWDQPLQMHEPGLWRKGHNKNLKMLHEAAVKHFKD